MNVEGHISRDGEWMEGLQVMFVEMVKRALPGAFTKHRYQMVCRLMGRNAASVVHILIVYKINELWLIEGAEPASLVLEKASFSPAHLCQITTRRGVIPAHSDSPAPLGSPSYFYCGPHGRNQGTSKRAEWIGVL